MFYYSSAGRQPKRLSRGLHVSRPCLRTAILPPIVSAIDAVSIVSKRTSSFAQDRVEISPAGKSNKRNIPYQGMARSVQQGCRMKETTPIEGCCRTESLVGWNSVR